jgi:hypothetical protein
MRIRLVCCGLPATRQSSPECCCDARLRMSTTALGLIYVAGVRPNMLVWTPGIEPRRGRKAVKARDAIGAKRTCRERRERVDLTKMTHNGHWRPNLL